jgi:FAD/FMN-containing dehydrogenase
MDDSRFDALTRTSGSSPLTDDAVTALRGGLRGEVIVSADAGYDAARQVWNGMIDRRPAVIARCADTADVVAAVAFGRERGMPVAVRGGGHSAAGHAVADGALVVDLSAMNGVTVDPDRRIAHAGGGATWSDFDAATQAHGLATTGGAISTTGVGGLTLGGGLGYLMRSFGLACDNLVAAEVVTADGRVVEATGDGDGDGELLWGLRGGGGNFGVVTRLDFTLHPVGPVLGGMLVHPAERAAEVLRFYREATEGAPEGLSLFAALLSDPAGVPIVALMPAWNGSIDEGERVLAPIRAFGPPLADTVGPMPYTALQTMLDEGFPSGLPVYWKSHFLTGIGDDALGTIVDRFGRIGSPLSAILIEHLGGAVGRVDQASSAFDHRDAEYNLAIISRWPEPAMEVGCVAWARELWEAMQPHARGVYVNYLGIGDAPDRVRAAYGDAKYGRLAALKARYDPDNLFRFNQNIAPAADARQPSPATRNASPAR